MTGTSSSAVPDAASILVREPGERQTLARRLVMQALLDAEAPLTRHELEARIGPGTVNRVTVYRVLDWLTERGLARRVTGMDRKWRFMVGEQGGEDHRHAHFRCTACEGLTCLPVVKLPTVRLPVGYRLEDVEVTVNGICARCSTADAGRS